MLNTKPKKIYLYKHNMQFVYAVDKNGVHWWTEQGDYLGRTWGFEKYTSHVLLDSYIKEMRGL